MQCDLCGEHVDPDDYQEHCEQHHLDGEYDARHPRPLYSKWSKEQRDIVVRVIKTDKNGEVESVLLEPLPMLNNKPPPGWRWYLVEYEFSGSKWSLDLLAMDDKDASARVGALFNARLLGERKVTIPAFAGAGKVARAICSIRNFLWK